MLLSVFLLLLIGLILSLNSATTNAVSSPLVLAQAPLLFSHSPSPTTTVGRSSASSTPAGGETGAVSLTLVDLLETVIAALIPALLGCLFIIARQHSLLRKREQQGWSEWIQLVQEQAQLQGREEEGLHAEQQEEENVPAEEQEELHKEAQDDAVQLQELHAPVVSGFTSSRLSRLKHRLRTLEEPPLTTGA